MTEAQVTGVIAHLSAALRPDGRETSVSRLTILDAIDALLDYRAVTRSVTCPRQAFSAASAPAGEATP